MNFTQKNSSSINNITSENDIFNMKNNTINNFYSHKGLSVNDNNIFFTKTLKVINPNIYKTIENNDIENNNNNISSFVKDLNFNDLNENYGLRSSVFMKKV